MKKKSSVNKSPAKIQDKPWDHADKVKDSTRRRRQEERVVRIVRVHKLTCHDSEDADVAAVAKELGVCVRTIRRDLSTLRAVYDAIGTSLLDN